MRLGIVLIDWTYSLILVLTLLYPLKQLPASYIFLSLETLSKFMKNIEELFSVNNSMLKIALK